MSFAPSPIKNPSYAYAGTFSTFAAFGCQIKVKTKKKDLPSKREAPGTVVYGKFDPDYRCHLIATLN